MDKYDGILREQADRPGAREAYLPNLYATSHAANLLELRNGDILCAWFSGSGEGNPDTNIVMARLPKGSDRWEPPVELSCDPERSEQNPVLFLAPDGRVWLLFTSNEPHNQKTARVCHRVSADGGLSWGDTSVLFHEAGIFLRQPIVVSDSGDWLLPAYYCKVEGDYSAVKMSHDQGESWEEIPVPGSLYRVQMNIIKGRDGTVIAFFRSREADRIYSSLSRDGGRTWSEPERTELPNNNSSIQALRLSKGHILMVYNDVTLERDQIRPAMKNGKLVKKTLRTPLTVSVSTDQGRSWSRGRNIQVSDEEYLRDPVGYSYPTVIQDAEGRVHIAYTYLRYGIKHLIFSEKGMYTG